MKSWSWKVSGPVLMVTMSLAGGAAMAQEPPPAAPPPAAEPATAPAAAPVAAPAPAMEVASPASKMRVGLNVVPMPFGTLKASAGGLSASTDTKFAFGLFPFFDYLFTPNLFGGIAVQYTFNVNSKDDTGDAAKQLDIMLRLGGSGYVADKLQLYGYVAPGYSIIMVPSDAGMNDPKGFMLGFHAGAMYDVTPGAFLNVELGYQLGFQSVSENGVSGDLESDFFQVGLGGGVRF